MLEARGQTSIAQVAAQAPNVSLRPQPQNGGSGLIAFIRGVGQTDFNYALDPGVGVYIDDVYIPTLSSSLLELIDLDRIEILRGPQGTLAGKNSIGGAIKLFSAKPQGDDSGSLRVSYGEFNELTVRGMADMKISDTLAMRVSGMSRGATAMSACSTTARRIRRRTCGRTTRAATAIPTSRPWVGRTSSQVGRPCAGHRAISSR